MVEVLDEVRIEVVDDAALAFVLGADGLHFIFSERKVPDVQVFLDSFFVSGFRDDGEASLHVPAESDLCCGLSVLLADGGEVRIGEDAVISFSQRAPCLRNDAVGFHDTEVFFTGEERMRFDLVDGRDDFHVFAKVDEDGREIVGYADGFCEAVFGCFFEVSVSGEVVAYGLMEEDEVEVIKAGERKGAFYGCVGVACLVHVLHPDFRRDEEVFSLDEAVSDSALHSFAKGGFIAVSGCGIKEAVTCLDGFIN